MKLDTMKYETIVLTSRFDVNMSKFRASDLHKLRKNELYNFKR
jgi:hypothetical protein